MTAEIALVNATYQLQKFPGKGGWTYASIPEVLQSKDNPFGWVKVKGSIDDYVFSNVRLMPMGNGTLFLPVKASIRKFIKKEAGEFVKVILFKDNDIIISKDEILACIKDAPSAFDNFIILPESEQEKILKWIQNGKNEATIVSRIEQTILKFL